MKQFLIITILCLSALTAKAQTIEVVLGKQPRVFLEKTRVMDNSVTFAYLEAGYKAGSMLKLFHEQKFWKAPVYALTNPPTPNFIPPKYLVTTATTLKSFLPFKAFNIGIPAVP